jgi:hypothetical protein
MGILLIVVLKAVSEAGWNLAPLSSAGFSLLQMPVGSGGGGRKCDALGSKFNWSRVWLAFTRGIETGVNNDRKTGRQSI